MNQFELANLHNHYQVITLHNSPGRKSFHFPEHREAGRQARRALSPAESAYVDYRVSSVQSLPRLSALNNIPTAGRPASNISPSPAHRRPVAGQPAKMHQSPPRRVFHPAVIQARESATIKPQRATLTRRVATREYRCDMVSPSCPLPTNNPPGA